MSELITLQCMSCGRVLYGTSDTAVTCPCGRTVQADRTETTVVHCKRDSYDVYIGRPSKFGNPFKIGVDGTREQVIAKYRDWLMAQPALVDAARTELRGKRLGCWCAPQACHGHVLAAIANGDES